MARGRVYQRQGRVEGLAVTEDGRLLATVLGGDRYTVSVWREPGKGKRNTIESTCTCPVGYSGCKHAVAVVAAYLQALADEEAVPLADPDYRRWAKLERSDSGVDDDELDEWEVDEYDDDDEDDEWQVEVEPTRGKKRGSAGRTRAKWDETIRRHIHEKILFAVDACLNDPCDVVDDTVSTILDARWPKADWSGVADALHGRLKKMSKNADYEFSYKYKRQRISGWLLTALENAGRDDELLRVYETEAQATASYERLVTYLIAERKYEEAERWAREGIENTCEKLPGIASSLATKLCELARRRRKWDVVAADAAWRFFDRPGTTAFKELVDRAARAECAEAVRAAALGFLETGKRPVEQVVVAGGKDKGKRKLRIDSAWPLPVPDYLLPLMCQVKPVHATQGPHFDVLLDMAIDAKKPDDVLRWYDRMRAGKGCSAGSWGRGAWHGGSTADRVAAAVAKSHPERALEIYRQGLDSYLPHANTSAYESAAAYLKAMRPIMRSLKQAKQWDALLAEIREKYRNRPRFMETLDRLEGRTILATQKARRRKRT